MASGGSIGAEVMANRYDPDDLEASIDACRFSGRWEEALAALERYAQVFDIGAAAFTLQYHNSEEARSYYWSVMAEAMLEYRGDADQALLCLRKAAQYNISSPDWRILTCRVMLRSAAPILMSSGGSGDEEGEEETFRGEAPEARTVLLEPLQSFTQQDAEFLLSTVQSITPSHVRRHFVLVLSILPCTDVVFICQDILEKLISYDEGVRSVDSVAAMCCLITARNVLRQVPIDGSLGLHITHRISDYRFWLILDAAATRSAIHELLGDLAAARSDVLAVLHEISPLGSEVSRVRGLIDVTGAGSEGEGEDAGAGRDQGPCILEALCGPARRTALHLAARLPLLEKDIGLTHECYRSFRRCIGADSYFRPYMPTRVVLGLRIECALLLLEYAARSELGAATGDHLPPNGDDSLKHHASPPLDPDITLNTEVNLETALLLLRSCHETMTLEPAVMLRENPFTSRAKGDQFVDIELSWGERVGHDFVESEPSIELLAQSMIKCLNKIPSDPMRSLYVATPSHVAYLIAGILTKAILNFEDRSFKDRKIATEVFEILHWGISNETTPPLNLLWSLARSYVEVSSLAMIGSSRLSGANSGADSAAVRLEGFDDYFGGQEIETAINLLDQCISIVLHSGGSASGGENSAVPLRDVEYPLISEWFGLGYQPSVHLWLPFSLAADLCLNSLEDAPRALMYANKGLGFMFAKCDIPIYLVDVLRLELPLHMRSPSSQDADSNLLSSQRVLPFGVKLLDTKCYIESIQPLISCKEAMFECMSPGHTAPFETEMVSLIMGESSARIHMSEDDLLGIKHLLFTAARAQAAWSRSSALLAPERSLHRAAALRVMSILLKGLRLLTSSSVDVEILELLRETPDALSPVASRKNRSIPIEDIILEYAVLLIEDGDVQRAIAVVNDSVCVLESSHRLFHLQGLVLDAATASGSCNEDFATNLAIIRAASNLSKQSNCWNNLNIMVTQSKMHWKHGNVEVSIRIMDELLSKLQELTSSQLLFSVTFFRASHDVYHSISSHNSYRRTIFLIEALTYGSKLFRSVHNFDKASACVLDAWRILYCGDEVSPSSAPANRSMGNSPDAVLSQSSSENGPAVGDVDSISYWVDALRSVPTFEGWRLAQGSGWAADNLQWRRAVSLVAEETAQLILVGANMSAESIIKNVHGMMLRRYDFAIDEERLASASRRDDSLTSAWEFLALSVAIDPTNPHALLSCCKFEMDRMEEEFEVDRAGSRSPASSAVAQSKFSKEHHRDNSDLDFNFGLQFSNSISSDSVYQSDRSRILKCIDFASRALQYNENDSEAWLVLGMAFERAAQSERAAECFLRAVERDGRNPLRDFAVALIEA